MQILGFRPTWEVMVDLVKPNYVDHSGFQVPFPKWGLAFL